MWGSATDLCGGVGERLACTLIDSASGTKLHVSRVSSTSQVCSAVKALRCLYRRLSAQIHTAYNGADSTDKLPWAYQMQTPCHHPLRPHALASRKIYDETRLGRPQAGIARLTGVMENGFWTVQIFVSVRAALGCVFSASSCAAVYGFEPDSMRDIVFIQSYCCLPE